MVLADRFRIEKVLQEESIGTHYLARDLATGRRVTVMHIRVETLTRNPALAVQFSREVEIMRQLHHPSIVDLLQTYKTEEAYFLVWQYVSGRTLTDLLRDAAPLPVPQALDLALEIANALVAVHRQQVVHGRLEPRNILISAEGKPYLTGFHSARLVHMLHPPSEEAIASSYHYLSPEVCNRETIDTRADIWSLGVILYEMLTGKRPFSQKKTSRLLLTIMTMPPPDIQELRVEVNDALADLIYRMLAKDPTQRIPTIELVGNELESVLTGLTEVEEVVIHPVRFARLADPVWDIDGPEHNLPRELAPIIGRREELAEIERLLDNPAYRLLTLHGPGGIGKTRLALAAARQYLDRAQQDVYLVDLAHAENGDLLITAIADAIEFRFAGPQKPETQLINYLQNKNMLLVLDGFERAGSEPFLSHLLLNSVNIRLLVTSQRRLNLQEEWVLSISGLSLLESTSVEEMSHAPASRLFVAASRRVRPDYAATAADLADIAKICRLVEGVPLAIELAAAWMDRLTPREILDRLQTSFDFLATDQPDLPSRHRSARSVFANAWELLTVAERRALLRLSIFRGEFALEGARRIVGASLPTLNALTDKSLLQRSPVTGRFRMKGILREFSRERAAGEMDELSLTETRHARYYMHFLDRRLIGLRSRRQAEALSEIEQEMGNIRSAWQFSVATADWQLLDVALEALFIFYQLRGRQLEGADLFGQAIEATQAAAAPDEPLLCRLLIRYGPFCRFTGRLEEAKESLQQGLALARQRQNSSEIALALYQYGATIPNQPQAVDCWRESLRLAEGINDKFLIAEALNWLAFAELQAGNIDGAVSDLERSLSLRRVLGDEHGLANTLANLGVIHIHEGDYAAAQTLLQEGLQIHRKYKNLQGLATVYTNLCHIALNEGKNSVAQEWGEKALAHYDELGDKKGIGIALGNLGLAALNRGLYEQAHQLCLQSINLYEEIGLPTGYYRNYLAQIALAKHDFVTAWREFCGILREGPAPLLALDVLTGAAGIMATNRAKRVEAAAILDYVQDHPAVEKLVRSRAHSQLQELYPSLSDKEIRAMQTLSREKSLDDWIAVVCRSN